MRAHNQSTILVKEGYQLKGGTITANAVDDAINTLGSNVSVIGVTIIDTSGSTSPHKDAIQPIPTGFEPNAQFFGAISENALYSENTINCLSQMQGIASFDGGYDGLVVTHNKVRTKSQHAIHFAGVFTGEIHDNDATVVLTSLRIGGGHPRSFRVESFVDKEYLPIVDNEERSIIDLRGKGDGVHAFNLSLFRQISENTPYRSFDQHFIDTLNSYEESMIDSFAKESNLDIVYSEKVLKMPSLADVISSGEGGYTSYNRGRSGDAGNAVVPLLTVGEYITRGSLPYSNPNRIWAVGRYQFVPQTQKDAVSRGVVNLTDVLTPAVQEKIFIEWLLSKKRRAVFTYITTGKGLTRAMIALSQEWASIADPRTGRSYYDKRGHGDKAHTSVKRIQDALAHARSVYVTAVRKGVPKPKAFSFSVYNIG